MSDDDSIHVSDDDSAQNGVEKPTKWTENATTHRVIHGLEKFVLNQTLDKSYKKMGNEATMSSKRTLESLLARNGGHGQRTGGESSSDARNYTLDANGRVCLVRSSSKETSRHQELISLQKDTHELRCLREYLMLALEAIMHTHRQMMLDYVKEVNEKPRQIPRTAIDKALEKANTRMVADFAQMAVCVDESIAREEIRAEKRRKLKKSIEMETILMRMMLEMEDIREANPADLVRLFRSHGRASSVKPPCSSGSSATEKAAGDSL